MLKKLAFAVLGLTLMGGVARAQEAEDEEIRREPVRKIKVLENPSDISSFYRSSQGESYFGYEQGQGDSRYPIAGFYRNEGDGRWVLPLAAELVRVRALLESRLRLSAERGGRRLPAADR